MITEIGQSVLDELSSELTENIEDKKAVIAIEQGSNIFVTCVKLLIELIHYFFTAIGMILLVTFAFLNESILNGIQTATIQSLLNLHQTTLVIAFVVSFSVLFVKSASAFRNVQQEAEGNKSQQIQQAKATIELVEEVLHRHRLIELAGKNKL